MGMPQRSLGRIAFISLILGFDCPLVCDQTFMSVRLRTREEVALSRPATPPRSERWLEVGPLCPLGEHVPDPGIEPAPIRPFSPSCALSICSDRSDGSFNAGHGSLDDRGGTTLEDCDFPLLRSLEAPDHLEFRDLLEAEKGKDSSSSSSSGEFCWVESSGNDRGVNPSAQTNVEGEVGNHLVEVESSDDSSVIMNPLPQKSHRGRVDRFEEVPLISGRGGSPVRKAHTLADRGGRSNHSFPNGFGSLEDPSSRQAERDGPVRRDMDIGTPFSPSQHEANADPLHEPLDGDINEAVDRLLAVCQQKADLDALGGLYPERSPSRSGPSSQGAAPAERAAAEASAEGFRLGCQERGLLALIYEVFEFLPRLLKAKKSKAVQDSAMEGVFPLPLPRVRSGYGCEVIEKWEEGAIRGLNWLVCQSFRLGDGPPNSRQAMLLDGIQKGLVLLEGWKGLDVTSFNPQDLLRQRWINSYGEEVHVAQSVRWENIRDSLPQKGVAGIVPAWEICEDGFKDFILHPHNWLKAESDRVWMKPPKCMVPRESWETVCRGLVDRGVCGIMPLSKVFRVNNQPILGGIFGVPKNETSEDGHPILRLIMDFRPINENFLSLGGDLATLPVLSQMFQLELRPHEGLIISSEDIRAMFYIIGIPSCWKEYFAFSRPVPDSMKPPGSEKGDYVLFSKVLPMGYLNSVAVAQHLHRRLVIRAFKGQVSSSQEIRRDREFPAAPFYFRTYLDNFDLLSIRSKGILSAPEPSLIGLLQETYESFSVPRNTKKAVDAASAAEMQGAWIDGDLGICCSKGDKIAKYLASLNHVLHSKRVTRKQMQMLAGGLVYIFSFRRPLMSTLNEIWSFIVSFKDDKQWLPLPMRVQEELVAAFFLSVFSFMNFRLPINPVVTASDASETGGGLTASESLTNWGVKVSKAAGRGDSFEEFHEQGLLVISLFDGIGALRVALENLKVPLAGYVAVEKDEKASRVVESHFPSCTFCTDVTNISSADIRAWGAKYPNCCAVLVAGGPPCQGVSGLNASKKGAQEDPRSSLHTAFDRIKQEVKHFFTWCPSFFLMESVASMSLEDRAVYSKSSGVLPYKVDAQFLSPCRRPRLWWFNWTINSKENVEIFTPSSSLASAAGEIRFHYTPDYKDHLRPGWSPANPEGKFLTFTTAQPMKQPRFRPAGIDNATEEDKRKWAADRFRFPPYQYSYSNGVVHPRKGWRMLEVEEKELMLGFPLNFTLQCKGKGYRNSFPQDTEDIRMTLLGNSWHVGVVSQLLAPLCEQLGLISSHSVSSIMERLKPGNSADVAGLLLREGVRKPAAFVPISQTKEDQVRLVSKLCHLVSPKGTDVLISSSQEPLPKTHRLRNSLSPKLWKWKTICGWSWRANGDSTRDHINKLELRAVETSLRWRLFRLRQPNARILHLVDSMVSLHVLNKGRTSSRRLRSVSRRIAALQIAGNFLLVLAYVNTKVNPADAPSRKGQKRKWSNIS